MPEIRRFDGKGTTAPFVVGGKPHITALWYKGYYDGLSLRRSGFNSP